MPPHGTGAGPDRSTPLEMELVIACLRSRAGGAETARLPLLLRASPDWPHVLRIAAYHKVSLLVYHSLKTYVAEDVPPAVMSRMRANAAGTARRGLFLVGELVKTLSLFEARGIKALPFKGPAVAYGLYGSLGLREFGDLDILVQKKDVPEATALLVSQGYCAPDQIADTADRPFLQFRPFLESPESQGVFNFYRNDGAAVELHWRFTPRHFPFRLVEAGVWERLTSMGLPGLKAPNLSPEDMLLLLCVHGSKHCWERLVWICDIAELVRAVPHIDWSVVHQRARALKVERMVHVGLLLAADFTGAAVPVAQLRGAQEDGEAVRLAAWVRSRLGRKPLVPFGEMEEYQFVFKVRDVARDRLRYLCHLLVTPAEEDWEFLPLPGLLSRAYYLLRPIRLTLVYLRRRLFGGSEAEHRGARRRG